CFLKQGQFFLVTKGQRLVYIKLELDFRLDLINILPTGPAASRGLKLEFGQKITIFDATIERIHQKEKNRRCENIIGGVREFSNVTNFNLPILYLSELFH